MRAARRLLAGGLPLLLCLVAPHSASAQFPAELRVRVHEATDGAPVEGAAVSVAGGAAVLTDASGHVLLRELPGGRAVVEVTRLGYAAASRHVELVDGRRETLVVALRPLPLVLEALVVHGAATLPPGAIVLEGDELTQLGARTVGDALRGIPGVRIVDRGPGSRQTVRIRGSAADQVLVLLDGAPINDPITGAADLATVLSGDVERVTVVPGARSARWGAGAEAGVVLIESAGASAGAEAGAGFGSLDARSARLRAGAAVGSGVVAARLSLEQSDGAFAYRQPESLGGSAATRANADARTITGGADLDLDTRTGAARLTVGYEDLERGLPGPGYAPASAAREAVRRLHAAAGMTGAVLEAGVSVAASRMRVHDAAPPAGPAYDDTTRFARVRAHVRTSPEIGRIRLDDVTARLEGDVQLARSSAFDTDATVTRTLLAGMVGATLPLDRRGRFRLAPALRLDVWDGGATLSHDLTLNGTAGPLAAHLAWRSAFRPPDLADLHFERGIGVRPNAALRPERVPLELEVGASLDAPAGLPLRLGATAYRGDVRDMVVWAPDFRFVWSPRNHDVRRWGAEAWARAEPLRGLVLDGSWTYTRVTYDWPGDADTVQLVYRPPHSGSLGAAWQSPAGIQVHARALYTGARYPVPAKANRLDGFWDVDLSLAREWALGTATLRTTLGVQRLFDNRDAFVHGYPEPGRALRLEASIGTAGLSNQLEDR